MILESQLLTAIKESGISKIAVIDDAFDAPEIDDDSAGQLLDYFGRNGFGRIRDELSLTEDDVDEATAAINQSDYESEKLIEVVGALYAKFVSTLDDRYDPNGLFQLQTDNIRNLTPILKLLERCQPRVEVFRVGSDLDGLTDVDPKTHLIFVDFYLQQGVSEQAGAAKRRAAKAKALEVVTKLVKSQGDHAASVILMSSADVEAEADKFRADITGDNKSLVFASRFAFVKKTELKMGNGGEISIHDDAGDPLLDVLQSYEFARATHAALQAWFESAIVAADTLRSEIAQLHLKDFAYLLRFRLAQEGEGLLEYLEWFFGECLLDALGRTVDEKTKDDERIAALRTSAGGRVEGAFDGPTQAIAALYHRARVENPRTNRKSNFRLGDLYASGTGKDRIVRAILNPDCDLVLRGDKRTSNRLLTVLGKLKRFDAPEASVSDFILLSDKPHNIVWDKKNIETFPFEEISGEGSVHEFVGTLRPLYAQELQRNVLSDLGRVGVSVAPAMGFSARAKIVLRLKDGKTKELALGKAGVADCYVVPSRGGNDKSIVLFRRRFAANLLEALLKEDPALLSKLAGPNITQMKKKGALEKLAKMHRTGISFEEIIDLGVFLTSKKSLKGSDQAWCYILVEMVAPQ